MERKALVKRETKETTIKAEIDLDGRSNAEITTGIRFFDHMLAQLAQHGVFDIKISAVGSDQHHVVEDVAISLGKAFSQALGDRQGIVRMAHAIVPMDDALVMVALDIGGRGYVEMDVPFNDMNISGMSSDLVRHFIISFASEAKFNIHARVLSGANDHHKAEALFKALARALDDATRLDQRIIGKSPSTKDTIER